MNRKITGAIVLCAVAFSILTFVPLIHVDKRGLLGTNINVYPAYESPSCAFLGIGTGYWGTYFVHGVPQWTYNLGCPPNYTG